MKVIYTTFATKTEARKLSQQLVKNRLAVCVNIFKIDSIYRWKGRIEQCGEYAAFIKIQRGKSDRVKKFILEHHSYEMPCILEVDIFKH